MVDWIAILIYILKISPKISARRRIILTEIFHGLPQSIQEMSEEYIKLSHASSFHFLSNLLFTNRLNTSH
jgi:hypothetical protein